MAAVHAATPLYRDTPRTGTSVTALDWRMTRPNHLLPTTTATTNNYPTTCLLALTLGTTCGVCRMQHTDAGAAHRQGHAPPGAR